MTLTAPPAPAAAPARGAVWLPVAAAATTLLLWASAFVAIRHLGHTVTPGALSLGRLLVASLALGVLVFRRPRRWPVGRQWLLLVPCGVLWFGVYNVALNESERRIDAGTAALIIQIGVIVVALLATVFLGERLHRWLVAGMVIGFSGVALIGLASAEGGTGDLVGVLLAVVCALAYAVGVLTQKPLLRDLPGLEVTWLACLLGTAFCLPWSGDLAEVVSTGSTSDLLWIVYLGLGPTAVAFSTWAYALARTDAGKLSLTTFLVPALATALAWLLLDEVPPGLAFVGGVLCIAGVALTRRTPAPTKAVP